jgi:hypothetical protein
LDEDLRAAALTALTVDRAVCRRFAEGFSWSTATKMFVGNLVPTAGLRSRAAMRKFKNARVLTGLQA